MLLLLCSSKVGRGLAAARLAHELEGAEVFVTTAGVRRDPAARQAHEVPPDDGGGGGGFRSPPWGLPVSGSRVDSNINDAQEVEAVLWSPSSRDRGW